MTNQIEQTILDWCRAQGPRPVGMRDTDIGKCVAYLDGGNLFISEYGVPKLPKQFDPKKVLAHGQTWEEVAKLLSL